MICVDGYGFEYVYCFVLVVQWYDYYGVQVQVFVGYVVCLGVGQGVVVVQCVVLLYVQV